MISKPPKPSTFRALAVVDDLHQPSTIAQALGQEGIRRLVLACLGSTALLRGDLDLPESRLLIYVSLRTHAYFSRPEFFRIILDGLAKFDADVIATVGAHNAPESLGPQPDTVHLERWLPLPLLLPRCTMVVCHGGSGTMLASLAAGLPLLVLPRGADQFENGAACERAGLAQVVPPEALTSEAVADAVEHLLADETYRCAAARLRAELEAMPAPMAVVPLLERLAHG